MSSIRQASEPNSVFKFLRQASPERRLRKNLSIASLAQRAILPLENRLLSVLSADEYQRLAGNLERIHFPKHGIVYEAGDTMRHATFLNRGIVSVVAITNAADAVEVGIVGREGFIGVPLILGADTACYQVVAQTRIEAVKIDSGALREHVNRSEKLQQLLLRYADVLETQIIQSVLCRVAHSLKARVARWLLMTTDSLDSDAFSVTHEQLSIVLGKHRNRVGIVTSELEKEGLVECGRGSIRVVDRKALEAVACECYGIVRQKINWIGRV